MTSALIIEYPFRGLNKKNVTPMSRVEILVRFCGHALYVCREKFRGFLSCLE